MKILISLSFLMLIIPIGQCGLIIDGVFGALTNTTHDIAHNVGGIVSFGRGLVFGEKKNSNPTQAGVVKDKKGLLGDLFDSVHDNVRHFEDNIKNVFTNKHGKDNGLLDNIADRVKNRVINIKGFIFGTTERPRNVVSELQDQVVRDKTKPARDFFNKLIFGKNIRNTTTSADYQEIMEVVKDIESKYHNSKNNAKPGTKKPDFQGKPHEGEGLIDIRAAFDDIKEESEKFIKTYGTSTVRGPFDINNVGKNRDLLKNNLDASTNEIESNLKEHIQPQ